MEKQRLPDYCPVANVCAATSEGALPCGEDPSHLPPALLAEQVCVNALGGKVRTELSEVSEGIRPVKAAGYHTAIAWAHLEAGMATPDNGTATGHFDTVLEHADKATHNPNSYFSDALSSAILRLYRPVFMSRRYGQLPSPEEKLTLQLGLGSLYDALLTAPVHVPQSQHILDAMSRNQIHRPCLQEEGTRIGMAAKLVGMLLAARQNIFLYPASDREGRAGGEFTGFNHDAYVMDGDQKIPLKIRTRSQADAQSMGARGSVSYDDQIVYINMRGLVNETLETLRQEQPAIYKAVCRDHGNRPPNIFDLGRFLRNELNDRPPRGASLTLLDKIAWGFEQLVYKGREKPAQPAIQDRDRVAVKRAATSQWEILPPETLGHLTSLHTRDSQLKMRTAAWAYERYLRYGNSAPSREQLQELITDMREVKDPYILVRCAGAYLDLARDSHTTSADAVRLVEAAATMTNEFAARSWREISPESVQLLYRCNLDRVYAEKCQRALSGEPSSLDDEARLYLGLLRLGNDTLEPAVMLQQPALREVRGIQFEIALHLLNARLNVRSNKIMQSMWPSLPREDMPHDFNFEYHNGWDAAVTTDGFLNQGSDCRFLQIKGVNDNELYHPSIIVISGREDFGTATTADIIKAALQEVAARSPQEVAEAKANLAKYEQVFLRKLNM